MEAIWLEIDTIDAKLLLCNVYRPPNNIDFWLYFARCTR